MKQQHAPGLADRLRGITVFLETFAAPDFNFGAWSQQSSAEGEVLVAPQFSLGDEAISFVQAAYDFGWVLPQFDWMKWNGTQEADRLRNEGEALAQASPEQLARLLTVCIRQDRFAEGALQAAFESGILTRILQRAAVILTAVESSRA
jgi:hypothetical protein